MAVVFTLLTERYERGSYRLSQAPISDQTSSLDRLVQAPPPKPSLMTDLYSVRNSLRAGTIRGKRIRREEARECLRHSFAVPHPVYGHSFVSTRSVRSESAERPWCTRFRLAPVQC